VDRTAPRLGLSGPATQKLNATYVTASCDEPCVLVASATVTGVKGASTLRVAVPSKAVAAGQQVRLAAKPEDRTVAIQTLEATLARYPSSSAATQAAYQLAALRYDAGQHAAARSAYEIVLARGASGTLRTLAQAGIGYAWEAERDYPKAIDVYRGTLSRLGPKDFYYETLLMDLGRSEELAGRKAEAIETYRRLLKEIPQARRAPEIRARLTALGAGA